MLSLVAGCISATEEEAKSIDALVEVPKSQPIEVKVIEDAFHFFVIGDWGRNGDDGQQELADMMSEVARVVEPEIIITTGDNFYPNGVASVDDPYWNTSYEQVYKGYPLFVPWYATLGNHDYRGSIQAQIDYTNKSKRWNLPAQYYHHDFVEDEVNARLVFLDTSPFNDEYYEEEKYAKVHDQDTISQLLWMNAVLSSSKADWNIVIGHHPMYTGGKRINDKNHIRPHLEKRLNNLNVDAYFAGHEHDMQHIKPEGKMHHFISGAGAELRPTSMLDISLFAEATSAFAVVSLTKTDMFVQFISHKGEQIYEYRLAK